MSILLLKIFVFVLALVGLAVILHRGRQRLRMVTVSGIFSLVKHPILPQIHILSHLVQIDHEFQH
jgi:hypothetical protein